MAAAEDAPAIVSVLDEAFAEYRPLYTEKGFSTTTPGIDQIGTRMNEGPMWVALSDEIVVGTVSAVTREKSLYIRGMAVLPSTRGKRIGELLLQEIEAYAAERGIKRLFLSTTPFLSRAIKLYERYGFKRCADGPNELFGTPLFTMEKQLDI